MRAQARLSNCAVGEFTGVAHGSTVRDGLHTAAVDLALCSVRAGRMEKPRTGQLVVDRAHARARETALYRQASDILQATFERGARRGRAERARAASAQHEPTTGLDLHWNRNKLNRAGRKLFVVA